MKKLFTWYLLLTGVTLFSTSVFSATKTSKASGNWGTASTWNPTGVPASGDDVIIAAGHTVTVNNNYTIKNVTVNSGGVLKFNANRKLTISNNLVVNGTMTMNSGDIGFSANKSFTIGATGSFTWEPRSNTVSGATLFTNGIENFHPTSTLIIKKWYNFSVPLGSVVTGNFGNVEFDYGGFFINEWDQDNYFQAHQILGNLTIETGWIVLDKSSSISNTSIGSITLSSSNAYLDLHSGTHNSSFTLSTGSITINNGMLNGIYNGNGSLTINVSGNIVNTGKFFGIYNNGVSGIGNGTFKMNVNGSYTQSNSASDFRGIYNLSSFNAGVSTLVFGSINFSGGWWMGQYGCHVNGNACYLTVNGNVSINFTSVNDIFRGVGLSILSSTYNTPSFTWVINGDLTISGNNSGEFISNASNNQETVTISGNVSVAGGNNRFNYGAPGIDHPTTLNFNNNLTVSNGSLFLSAFGNSSNVTINGNTTISGGTMSHKGGNGVQNTTINGNYVQTGGNMYVYNNASAITTVPSVITINGNFTQSGGTINFSNQSNPSTAEHVINLNGPSYSVSGYGVMTAAGPGTNTKFGNLVFARSGVISFSRSGSHYIQQVKQLVKTGNTLLIASGNVQVASHSSVLQNNLFKIESGGTMVLGQNQIMSNGSQSTSSFYIENNGLLTTTRTQGLYDGTNTAAVSATGNLTYYLEPSSIIEYNGNNNQVITGTGNGTATTNNQKYGILRINFNGTTGIQYVNPVADNVYIRTQLDLVKGEFFLNNYKITIESGNTNAITRTSGYIKSETNSAINNGIVRWENLTSGSYTFPFAVSSTEYIPVILTPTSGNGYAEISTRRTLMTNNTPWTGLSHVAAVTNMYQNYVDVSVGNVIDRWWVIQAPGLTGNLSLTYTGSENTCDPSLRTGIFSVQAWNGSQWLPPQGNGTGVTSGTGTVTVTSFSDFLPLVLVSQPSPLPVELIAFTAEKKNMLVELEWKTASEKNNDYFMVEKSRDGSKFESIGKVNGAGTTSVMQLYHFTDESPLKGISYYRLRQVDFDGTISHSRIAKVEFGNDIGTSEIEISSIAPNPFSESFIVEFTLQADGETLIRLVNGNGKSVYHANTFRNAGSNQFEFRDGSKLPRGTYFLLINQGEFRASRKIMK
ncbi:MAG: hypothetical protein LC117_06145 [Bacteroidia bacterium]|nr:hypothetical protein [Bacteroidia bacterium]MCZ2277491.1 hypothetical protein [Bacteroidia bacterium]